MSQQIQLKVQDGALVLAGAIPNLTKLSKIEVVVDAGEVRGYSLSAFERDIPTIIPRFSGCKPGSYKCHGGQIRVVALLMKETLTGKNS